MTILTPPKVLREKLGEDGVDALVDLVNKANEKQKEDILLFVGEKFEGKVEALEERFDVKLESLAGRFDSKLDVVEEKFERRLAEEIAKVRVELAGVQSGLEVKIAQSKSEIIKWMFIFWAGQLGVMTALFLAFRG